MELWIRSQNKELLTKTDYVYLETSKGLEILGGNHYMINQYLGKYETKERALEVLDEIQQILVPKFKLIKGKIEGSFDGTIFKSLDKGEIQQMSCYVYEMPKE